MHSEFISEIVTTADKAEVEMALSQIVLALDQPEQNITSLVDKYMPIRFAAKLSLSQSAHDDLKALQDNVSKMNTIDVTIAIDPTKKLVNQLSAWFRTNLDQSCVVNMHTDPTIGAGAKLIYKGKYIDLSFAKLIQDRTLKLQ